MAAAAILNFLTNLKYVSRISTYSYEILREHQKPTSTTTQRGTYKMRNAKVRIGRCVKCEYENADFTVRQGV